MPGRCASFDMGSVPRIVSHVSEVTAGRRPCGTIICFAVDR
jgi:hypothetical protein